jgi:ABC-type amino acid transport substrate-binding protein
MTVQQSNAHIAEAKKETTFERVVRTNTLRCGYIPIRPMINKDANTGELSGVSYDLVNQMAQNLGLKVEWVGESGFVSMSEDLDRGRFDMICNTLMPGAKRARALDFSRTLFMMPALLWINGDDMRVGDDLSWANDPEVTFSFIDGIVFDAIARREFPKATIQNLPELTAQSEQLMDVVTKKADATINIAFEGRQFLQENPGTIKPASDSPVAHIFYAFPLPKGDYKFKTMIDTALDEMINNGTINRMLAASDIISGSYVPLKPIY